MFNLNCFLTNVALCPLVLLISIRTFIILNIYINYLDDNITSNVLKFAEDTKVFRRVNTAGDKQHLQDDLDRLVKWF